MRILHTSDWHFGRTLHGVDLAPAIDLFCQWLVETVRREGIDLVLVSGDVYDRPIPSLVAVNQLKQVLFDLSQYTQVILTAGNHDSSTRLGFASSLLREEITLITSVDQVGTACEVTNAAGERVLIYPVPYLEPEATRFSLGQRLAQQRRRGKDVSLDEPLPLFHDDDLSVSSSDDDPESVALGRSHQAVVAGAMELITEDLRQRRARGDDSPAVAMVHAFISGGAPSDSERVIEVGGVQDVRAATFDLDVPHPLDYVAAGHLHRPQNISGARVPIRYSGSPVAYSFSEAGVDKSVTIVDIDSDGVTRIEYCVVPVWRDVVSITGTLDEVLSSRYADKRQCFASITITDDVRPSQLKSRVLEVFPYTVVVVHESARVARLSAVPKRSERRSDADICSSFFTEVGGRTLNDEESRILRELFEQLRVEESNS